MLATVTEELANGGERISVSQETLRNELELGLTKLELSMRRWIGEELDKKASAEVVADLARELGHFRSEILTPEERNAVRAFTRGDFSRAQEAAIDDMIDGRMNARDDAGWTKRERYIAVAGAIFWVLSISLSILALTGAVHHG